MITVIDNNRDIIELQERLTTIFKNNKPEYITIDVGHNGNSMGLEVLYFEKHNFWFGYREEETKHWNAFGIGKPRAGKNASITCEINFPHDGIDRKIAGAFGKEDEEFVILHRGKIGGGKKGVGKKLFLNNYRGKFIPVIDGENENYLALIGRLNSQNILGQISLFVHEVERIKNFKEVQLEDSEQNDDIKSYTSNFNFREEWYGKKSYAKQDEIEAICNHGIVINTLAELLKNKGLSVGNDRKRDLFTIKNDRIDKIFEAKTDLTNSSIYSAIGQVLMYSAEKNLDKNMKILVLPEKLNRNTENIISRLGLEILYFHFEEERVIFSELDRLLK